MRHVSTSMLPRTGVARAQFALDMFADGQRERERDAVDDQLGDPLAAPGPDAAMRLACRSEDTELPAVTRARLSLVDATMHLSRGDEARARAELSAVMEIEHDDAALAAEISAITGEVLVGLGDLTRGVEALRLAVIRADELDEPTRARCELALALAQLCARPASDADRFERAIDHAIARGATEAAGHALLARAGVLIGDDRLAAALEVLARVEQLGQDLADRALLGGAALAVGDICHDRGELAAAEQRWGVALGWFRAAGFHLGSERVALRRARLYHAAGRLDAAAELAEQVRGAASAAGASDVELDAETQLALLDLEAGAPGRAAERARAALGRARATRAAPVLRVLGSIAAEWSGHDEAAGTRQPPLTVRATRVERAFLRGASPVTEHALGWDVRVAARIAAARHARVVADEELAAPPVRLADDGQRLRRGTSRVDFAHRAGLCRILRALIAAVVESSRAAADDEPTGRRALTAADLFAAGWPGQQIDPEAAVRRVYWAVATLRRIGLGAALRTDEAGYSLDPARLELVPAEAFDEVAAPAEDEDDEDTAYAGEIDDIDEE